LHDLWLSPGLVHNIYIFGGSCPLTEFCQVQNSLCVQVLRSRILAALLHGTPAAGVSQTLRRGTRNGIMELCKGRHLYSAGRPSRCASAHILVSAVFIGSWPLNCRYCMLMGIGTPHARRQSHSLPAARTTNYIIKYSAAAEIGDRLSTTDMVQTAKGFFRSLIVVRSDEFPTCSMGKLYRYRNV